MTDYVTVQQVDDLLGLGWEGDSDDARAVLEANAYLSALTFKSWETQPDAVTRAGAELARMSAQGKLYSDADPDVKRKMVKAGSVESETEYQDGSVATVGAMALVNDLLKPYLLNVGAVRLMQRL